MDTDVVWMTVSAAFVVLMVPALGIFYAGLVRRKNVISTFLQCLAVFAAVAVVWSLVGYSLVFGGSVGGFIGDLSRLGFSGVGETPNAVYAPKIPELLFLAFQAVVAGITPALILGAVVERAKLKTILAFSVIWCLAIYSPIAHWVFNEGGWLRTLGAIDFAGGYAVHMAAGLSALAAAIVVGPRIKAKKGESTSPSNIPYVILGAGLLWFGWYGFNAGSTMEANNVVASVVLTTSLSAAAAGLSWMAVDYIVRKKPSAVGFSVAAVCGLVAITPGAGFVGPVAAIIIGLASGVVSNLVASWRAKSGIDDTLDVFACHGVNGTLGLIATGIFASAAINAAGANGLLLGNPSLLVSELIGIVAVAAYAFIGTFAILKALGMVTKLRVSPKEEEEGLDIAELGESLDE
ncbi:MAG: ammonium transporter [Candidatus Bathyarchaeota archaeon]|nr:ammonium transporter [Candidatus Bathyarchaeota archaeon]